MRTHEPFDEQAIQALMENLPMSKFAPEDLKNRLLDLAASPEPRHRAVRRPMFAMAFASALVVTAIAAVLVSMPTKAAAKSWEGIRKAVQSITSMEMDIKEFEKGKLNHTVVAFGQGTVLVQPDDGEIVFIKNGVVQVYDKDENTVQEITLPAGTELPDVPGIVLNELSMKKMLAQYEQEYGKANIKIGPLRTWQGRQVYDATMQKPDGSSRANIVADAATDRPIFIEAYNEEGGKWVKDSEITARYNVPLDLKPKWPAGAKFEKLDVSKMIKDAGGTPPPLEFGK